MGLDGRGHTTELFFLLHGSSFTSPECRGLHHLNVGGNGWREMAVDGFGHTIEPILMKLCMGPLLHPPIILVYINRARNRRGLK